MNTLKLGETVDHIANPTGRFASESVAGLNRNQWPLSSECAVESMVEAGSPPQPDLLPHVSPLGWEHIILTSEYSWKS